METAKSIKLPIEFPEIWTEETIKFALNLLGSLQLDYQERANLEMIIARNAEAVNESERKKQASRDEIKYMMIVNSLHLGLEVDLIAKIASASRDYVNKIKEEIN